MTKQALRDLAIAVAFQPPVHCTQSEDMPMPGPGRLSERGPPKRTLFERQPEPVRGQQAEIEVAVERQVNGNH